MMEFRAWFWEKFEEWRKGTTKGPTAYARYLGIDQPKITAWLNGDYKPGMDGIKALAKKYPDVYRALGLPEPEPDLSAYPPEVRGAVTEIRQLLSSTDPADWGNPDFVAAVTAILARYGAKDITIE